LQQEASVDPPTSFASDEINSAETRSEKG